MSMLSRQFTEYLGKGSMIRQMFETGIAMKKQYGEDAVCDFSLGNPDLPAPPQVRESLADFCKIADQPFAFGYMPNNGYLWARELLADYLSKEQGAALGPDDVMLTCGASGAINAFLRVVLDPGDEVLALEPCFVEYGFYAENHHGVFKTVPSTESFDLDLAALDKAMGPKARVLILNSPNNPTGKIYPKADLEGLAALLRKKSREYGRPVYLLADEPYRFLAYDGAQVPALLPMYENAVLASSFSKNLSLPGERMGYLALTPLMEDRKVLMGGLVMANRILGFVNPPVVGQHLLKKALGSQVDVSVYEARRNAMAEVLRAAGYSFHLPEGAFYFFPKVPGGDDVKFVKRLVEEKILAVPGSGFRRAGHFRLAFCVDEKVIRRAAKGFAAARKDFK